MKYTVSQTHSLETSLKRRSNKLHHETDQHSWWKQIQQESHAEANKPRYAAAVLFGLKFADDIHYKFQSRQASKARLLRL